MAKDRAAPFSKKHRRYWIPVTGGMLLIGAINVTIGVCTYDEPVPPQRMEIQLPGREAGLLGVAEIPAPIMREFATRYPRTIPAGARRAGEDYEVVFRPGAPRTRAVFRVDGTFVRDE